MAVSINVPCDSGALLPKGELDSRISASNRGFVRFSRPRIDAYPSMCTTIRNYWIRALVVDPSNSAQEGSSQFAKRMERAWLISKQPSPVSCSSCDANGSVECKWCKGTGFFILGDNILCEVPSRNTACVICMGKGLVQCTDCKGTGFRAKWLDQPPMKVAKNFRSSKAKGWFCWGERCEDAFIFLFNTSQGSMKSKFGTSQEISGLKACLLNRMVACMNIASGNCNSKVIWTQLTDTASVPSSCRILKFVFGESLYF